eukprot:136500-Chlamydomonas_euryale.AAC.1
MAAAQPRHHPAQGEDQDRRPDLGVVPRAVLHREPAVRWCQTHQLQAVVQACSRRGEAAAHPPTAG